MRRWLAVAAAGCLLLLAGCAKQLPPGTDGDLVDDWPMMPVPQQVLPHVGDCYERTGADLGAAGLVDCTSHHYVETTYVGSFTGADSDQPDPPQPGSAAMSAAFATCSAPTRAYLGGEWHSALVNLMLTVPDATGWRGGARWYRCAVNVIAGPDFTTGGGSSQSLKGALVHAGFLAATCIDWDDAGNYIQGIVVISCASPHRGEFVGYYTAPFGPFPPRATADRLGQEGCRIAVAHYLGFASADQDFNDTVGWLFLGLLDQVQWNMGDRTARCYAAAYTKDGKFTASVKGIKNKPAKG